MNKRIAGLIVLVVLIIVAIAVSSNLVETNKAGYSQVKQAAITGTLTCRLEPGMYGQMFGDIHTYKEAQTFFFTADKETGQSRNQSLPTRFNDGAKADVSGSLRVVLPGNCEQLIQLHRKFRSMNGVMEKLVLPAIRKALFSTGPHMSAGESYAERRGEFASLAEDQLRIGVIRVDKHEELRADPITGEKKNVWVLTKRKCESDAKNCLDGYERDISALAEFGINITNFVIDGIEYPQAVLVQIETQRAARMNVITKQAEAKEADARAAKANAEARAQIAETRAAEEIEKTRKIVRAEAAREQARLEKEGAEYTKQKEILLGQGEATRKRLVLDADGALAQKLATLERINEKWAAAYAKRPVPSMVFGGGGDNSGGSTANADVESMRFIQLMNVWAAKQLTIDLTVPGGTTRQQK